MKTSIRTSALLLALALASAAAPAGAQQPMTARSAASPVPLSAALRPAVDTRRPGGAADRSVDVEREILVGASLGCVMVGALFLVFVDAYDGLAANGLVGCGFGAFVGGSIAFLSTVRMPPGWGRR